jgi:hypothetical protein
VADYNFLSPYSEIILPSFIEDFEIATIFIVLSKREANNL